MPAPAAPSLVKKDIVGTWASLKKWWLDNFRLSSKQ